MRASTGLNGLDEAIDGLRDGDNVVWQVDKVEDYAGFVGAFVERALAENRKVCYMRFALHKPLIDYDGRITVHELDARSGFEAFSAQVHAIATEEGGSAYYVFDCLSDLLSAWATDLMIIPHNRGCRPRRQGSTASKASHVHGYSQAQYMVS